MSTSEAGVLSAAEFRERVAARELRIGIVGLGYAGLPLALAFAEEGFPVVGIDLNAERVAAVNEGRSYLVDVPEERYVDAQGRLSATQDFGVVGELDALTICVPTPLSKTRSPDLTYVIAASQAVAEHLTNGQVVMLQSTTYPGTTQELVLPILEEGGRTVGLDVFLGYAPERVDPGNAHFDVHNTPKLIGGVTDECRARAEAIYATIVEQVVPVSSPMVAELAKLHENTFRAVNIALANELALMCDHLGVSAWEVIDAAATKPFAFLPHYPGPGLGGDCIPVVPHFLSWRLREYGYSARMIDAAHEINANMPVHVVHKIADALNAQGRAIKGSRILVLGAAYKPDVHDTRESPSLQIMQDLLARGADLRYCDPWVPTLSLGDSGIESVAWTTEEVDAADCLVMLTAHRQFIDQPHWDKASLVVDTRNVIPAAEHVWRI
ncbi:MAG: nucleotide sugar dehydrogenase [Solirubrobacteraceae bacterium MAG38_C4-C5]|nr:nucleotide sugar dehydrogenase [Candidatus Siliceabacter maunaloa]